MLSKGKSSNGSGWLGEINELYGTVLHAVIRAMLLQHGFAKTYHTISVQMFPLYESARRRRAPSIGVAQLNQLGQYLYQMDDQDSLTTSCLSIAIMTQAILFSSGEDSDLLIGIQKQDHKLLGHAWVRLQNGQDIDPDNMRRGKTILHTLSMYAQVQQWVRSVCESG